MNLPNKEKKNLADLSDKELAQLSPEELEEAKKAKANLLAIKKTDKEVGNMAKQEEWNEAVQQYTQEHNFSLEEAAEHLKKEMGAGKLGELMSWARLFRPEENPLVKAINRAVADRIAQGQPLFGPAVVQGNQGGQGNPPRGGQPNNITGVFIVCPYGVLWCNFMV